MKSVTSGFVDKLVLYVHFSFRASGIVAIITVECILIPSNFFRILSCRIVRVIEIVD